MSENRSAPAIAWLAIVLGSAASSPVQAQAPEARPAPVATGEAGATGESAAPAVASPATGLDRTSLEDRLALDRAIRRLLRHDTQGLREVALPDGTRVLGLYGRFLSLSTLTLGPDGSRSKGCRGADRAPEPAPDAPAEAPAPDKPAGGE